MGKYPKVCGTLHKASDTLMPSPIQERGIIMKQVYERIRQVIDNDETADQVIELLEEEWQKRRQHRVECIAAAKERGVQFGRPPMIPPDTFPEIYHSQRAKEITVGKAAEALGVCTKTYRKMARQYEEQLQNQNDE